MVNPVRGESTIKDCDGNEWKIAMRNNEICMVEKVLGIDDVEIQIFGDDEYGIKPLNSNVAWRAILFAAMQRYHRKSIVTLEDAGDLGDKVGGEELHAGIRCALLGWSREEYAAKIAEIIAKNKAQGGDAVSPPEQAAAAKSENAAPTLS